MYAFQVAIVDGDASYRWSLRSALQASHGLALDTEAANGFEALALAETTRPDLFLISRHLPGLNGVQIAAAIRHHFPQSRVILLTPNGSDEQCLEAARIGASAVLPRFAQHEMLRNTVRAVLYGEEPLQTWLTDRGTDRLVSPVAASQTDGLVQGLTTRELAVFDCLLMGHSTKEIAVVLRIADQTVKNRISSILHKLDLESRMAAVRLAMKAGWVDYGTGPLGSALPNDLTGPAMMTTGRSTDALQVRGGFVVPPTMAPRGDEQLTWS